MNKALNALKEANPKLFAQFMNLLTEDLGIGGESSSGTVICPNCQTDFQITLKASESTRRASRNGRKYKRKWNPKPKSLFNQLVTLAKIRRTTTGGVNAEFNKAMKSKLKGLTPAEIREVKIKWVAEQIAKGKSGQNAA